ncbi:MAG TPA: helix-turn-helix domain-containing protein [Candidatus Limnocylindria bacterium]|nr:helix-turn-helix domain-containing protein [Candidatus Limnocylindria bacterium]
MARGIGGRIREARLRTGLTQAEVARGRYTAAYISALERGLAKPSMAALTFISDRLGVSVRDLVGEAPGAPRLQADLLLASGRWQEALDAYRDLLDDDAASDGRQRPELLTGCAEALCRLGRGADAIRPAAEAAEAFTAVGRQADAAWARYWLAFAQYLQDNTAEARGLLLQLLADERAGLRPGPDFRFRLLTSLAHVEAWDGSTDRALAYMEEARALTPGISLRQRAAFLSGLALEYREAGDLERSVRAGLESLALYRAVDAAFEQTALETNLALTYSALGSLDRAQEHLARARAMADQDGDPRLESQVAEAEAEVAWLAGDARRAEERIAAVLGLAERGGAPSSVAGAYLVRARIARDRGDMAGAIAAYERATRTFGSTGLNGRLRDALAEWAETVEQTGDLAAATRLYAEALGRRRRDESTRVGTDASEHLPTTD